MNIVGPVKASAAEVELVRMAVEGYAAGAYTPAHAVCKLAARGRSEKGCCRGSGSVSYSIAMSESRDCGILERWACLSRSQWSAIGPRMLSASDRGIVMRSLKGGHKR